MIRLARAFLLLSVWIIGSVGQKQKNCIEVPSGKSCKATYYSGCTDNFLANHYPSLYKQGGTDQGTPNVTISTNDVDDKKLGTYSIVNITIYPDKGTRAFDVNLNSVVGWRCMLVTSKYNDTASAGQQTRTGYTFRLALNMFTNITVWSVPKSGSSRPARMLIPAGEKIVYPPENSSLWITKIFYKKDWDQQFVKVQFQPAPRDYGIQYYNIQLRKVIPSGTAGLSSRETTHAIMEFSRSPWINVKFSDVKPGTYKIKVAPFDDLSKNDKKCRCKRNGRCYPCLHTESPEFLMRKTQQNPTDPNMEYSDWPLETRDFLSRSSDAIFTDSGSTTAMTMEPSSMDSSLPDVSDNNSKAGGIFDENIGGSQGSEGEWIAPVSVLSAIGIAVGALVSIFALVFKRGGSSFKSKSAPKKESAGPSVTIIHDINHGSHAQDLKTSISETLRMNVEVKLFKKKEQFIDKNSESSIFVLWMTPRSFSNFERRLMRNKRIPFVTLMQIQRQLVVIESQMAKGSIQPRIQYCKKFILGSELDLFLDFLRNNTTGECRESWSSDEHTIPESQEKLQAFKVQYNRMDSGIQSDYENEAEFAPYEESIHEEYASMSAVTIGEYHLGAPVRHQQKTSASFPLFNYSIREHNGVLNGPRKIPNIPCLDAREKFISPEAMSCVDGSVLSEAIMVLNERNTKQKTASEDSLSLIDERISSYPTSANRRSETPVCFHNVIGCSEKEEEFLVDEEDERLDAEEDKLLDDIGVSLEEDILSLGGKSC